MTIAGLKRIGMVGLAALIPAFLSLSACGKKADQKVQRPPVPVSVATVIQKTVPVQLTAIGNVEALATIQVKSQIGGELRNVHFKEGQDVAKGALLFTIDPRPYEAQVKQAEANLAKDVSHMEYAREEARRYGELVNKGYVAREQYEQVRANASALEATVNADRAALDNSRLQLTYCYIYSPITGRLGTLLANQGNLIKANADAPMVTINQIQPIYVTFSLPEQNLTEVKKFMAQGNLSVDAFIAKDDKEPEHGVLTFVDNAVDQATGTIKLKGLFPNSQKRLWPGQFVNVALTLTALPNALVVPTRAVQTGQSGQYVFVLKRDNTVESRPVVAGRTIENNMVIEKGLSPSETVVTDGQLRLSPGAAVDITNPGKEGGPQQRGAADTVQGKKP